MSLSRFLLILPIALLLAACEPTEEERLRLDRALPDGCEVIEVGSYGDIRSLVVVRCDGRDVTTTNGSWRQSSGKYVTTVQYAAVLVE